ncbi:PREDICTED: glutamate-rich WD repeat-containing protein 1-like isoform X2 [Camelina sativa]|uniref:Glutamate-rich WD repeat-containing protein 1-like isoform X2 n=1 Tax=Camelina sativa TaxID=90675 RepID=A0ABM0Y0H9_CAMSA|nr:PREDICTED: glutamate-rich WD repeat-containing protein 1-like isoform X2 [Camelina sativa]
MFDRFFFFLFLSLSLSLSLSVQVAKMLGSEDIFDGRLIFFFLFLSLSLSLSRLNSEEIKFGDCPSRLFDSVLKFRIGFGDGGLKGGDAVVAYFEHHKHPITSIEWSAHEASTLTVTSSDHQLTIWDLSLEKDEEEEAEFKAQTKEQVNTSQDLPPQLLFVHQGQKDLKELHWHNQFQEHKPK